MILDTSAIVELVLGHPEAERIGRTLRDAEVIGIGGPTLAETALVLRVRLHCDPSTILHRLIAAYAIEVISFGERHWLAASDAFERFGKGRHPARLNFGDCLTYATAKLAGRPLLFVGEDFARTDLRAA